MSSEPPRTAAEKTGESLSSRAYHQIEDLIVRLDLQPGRAISEAELSARLGIGRTPIREALQRLAHEGLVLVSPRRGMFITEIRVDAQLRLIEVRRSLERLMASRAARLADAAQRQSFADIAAGMRAAGKAHDDIAFLRLDRELNDMVALVAANEFAASAIALSASLSRRFWYRYYRTAADLPLTCERHAAVAEAIADGDSSRAVVAADQLLDHIEQFTRAVFDQIS